eukprot:3582821-Pyramimonas_sp.AAC.1
MFSRDIRPYTARHLDLSSIGYLLLSKSRLAGSVIWSHLDTHSRYFVLNSSCRRTTELVSRAIALRISRRVRLSYSEV